MIPCLFPARCTALHAGMPVRQFTIHGISCSPLLRNVPAPVYHSKDQRGKLATNVLEISTDEGKKRLIAAHAAATNASRAPTHPPTLAVPSRETLAPHSPFPASPRFSAAAHGARALASPGRRPPPPLVDRLRGQEDLQNFASGSSLLHLVYLRSLHSKTFDLASVPTS